MCSSDLQMIHRLARSQAPVHISGESGSGKEMAARLMHMMGPRRDAPFVPVNCGAIPENLMESEFFGYRKGAFTGADQDKEGFFQAASSGTRKSRLMPLPRSPMRSRKLVRYACSPTAKISSMRAYLRSA